MIAHSKPWIALEDHAALEAVLHSGMVATGRLSEKFKEQFCQHFGYLGGLATSSGTAALISALDILGLTRGDEVIIPSYICEDVLSALQQRGVVPVCADLGEGWTLDPVDTGKRITCRTGAILAVNTFGFAAPIAALRQFGIPIIEDSCQSIGMGEGKNPEDSGDFTIFSFQGTKCLTTGEGGMIVTRNANYLDRFSAHQTSPLLRLSDLSSALGLSQLARYPTFLERRHRIQNTYTNAFNAEATQRYLSCVPLGRTSFRYVLEFRRTPFDALRAKLEKDSVAIRRGVDHLAHRSLGLADRDFANTLRRYETTVSVPYYPALDEAEIQQVINALSEVLDNA